MSDNDADVSVVKDGKVREVYRSHGYREFVRGGAASVANIVSTYPIQKVTFRQQIKGISMTESFKQIYHEGPSHLYRGIMSPLMQKTVSLSLMFGLYDHYLAFLQNSNAFQMSDQASIIVAAAGAGCSEAALLPFERVQTLMQMTEYNNRFRTTNHAFVELRHYGFREYYRGFSPVLFRNALSSVLFFSLREPAKNVVPCSGSPLCNSVNDFMAGGFLGATISTIVYPLNVIKCHMQQHLGEQRKRGTLETFRVVWVDRGSSARLFFRGANLNFIRSLLSWGIINVVYELT